MKHLLPICLLLLSAGTLCAQKNEASLDMMALKSDNNVTGYASLQYYRYVSSRRSLGIRLGILSNHLNKNPDRYLNERMLNLDLIGRWKASRAPWVRWDLEGGISGFFHEKHYLPGFFTPDCIVGLDKEAIMQLHTLNETGYKEQFYLGGLYGGSNLLFKVGKNWWTGLHLGLYGYWDSEQHAPGFGVLPGLEVSRVF